MQCHKPGHRASARCVSALLAVGALLTAAADFAGAAVRPASRTAALDVPSTSSPTSPLAAVRAPGARARQAPASALIPPLALALSPAMTDLLPPPGLRPTAWRAQPTRPAWRGAKAKAWHQRTKKYSSKHRSKRGSKSRSTAWRFDSERHANSYLLSHLPPAKDEKAAAAVHEAMALLGVPYRWGGTTRAGFDCSGFTQHVWGAAGVKIPRTVRAQARVGTRIPLSQAQPGDLVVFYPTQHHVGLYVGNGLVIDSPHTGSWVRPDPVRSMPVSAVVRVRA